MFFFLLWIDFKYPLGYTVTLLTRLLLWVVCLPFEVDFTFTSILILGGEGVSGSCTVTFFWLLGLRVGVRGVAFLTSEMFIWLCTACTVTLLLILSLRVGVRVGWVDLLSQAVFNLGHSPTLRRVVPLGSIEPRYLSSPQAGPLGCPVLLE